MRIANVIIVSCLLFFSRQLSAQTASFNAPDTVCRGQNITIGNTSIGQTTNLWNFCKQSSTSVITGVNIGDPGLASRPASIQVYKDGSNYIGFVSNEETGGSGVRRLNFGSNLLNSTPVVTTISTFSGQLDGPKGMRFLYDAGNWYGFFVADNWNAANQNVLVRLDFGNSLLNNPTINNFGNLGGVIGEYLTDLDIAKTSLGFIGFISTTSGKVFRINFGASITSTPTATNLGVLGGAKATYSFNLFQRNGNWYLFMPKDDFSPPSNSYLVNLGFGTSLLNTPTVTNYGNPGNLLNRAYDFLPFVDCESLKGYVLAPGANKIVEYTFPQDINSTTLIGRDIGNVANFVFPPDFSNVLIYNNEKYVFVTNQSSNTISRLKLSSNCNSFGVPSSILTNPPVFHIDSVGTYNVSLVINENLATEARACKEIVVVDSIKKPDARINNIICSTDSIRLTIANIDSTATYSWTGPNGFTSIKANISVKFNGNNSQNGNYIVTTTGRCGIKKDTVNLNISCVTCIPDFNAPDTVCVGQNITILNQTACQSTNLWNFCKQSPSSNISGINLGNLGVSQRPGYIQVYKDGTNYYGFVGNEQTGGAGLARLNFGNSILNTPTSTVISTFSGQLDGPKGMQFFNENGNWYGIIVADNWNAANDYILVRLSFGNSLSNTPTITNFGDLGGIINEYISDIEIRKTPDGYIGFISSISGKLFRISFGNSITNTPVAVNLGVFGVAKPSIQISLLFRKNNWFLYFPKDDVTPANCSIGSLNFGTSLLNSPTYINYGNPNSLLNRAYDFMPFVDCDNLKGYVLAPGANKIIEYTFPNDIFSTSITGRDIGNIATFNFPSSFSEPIIFNNEKYVFVTNQTSNTISRLKLSTTCNSFGVPSSTQTNPPVFHIDSIGTYNVSLTIDANLASEAKTCREIVVVDSIKKPDARINTITCSTDSIRLIIANIDTTATYSWTGPNGFNSVKPNISIKFNGDNSQNGSYIVTATGRCGIKKDTINLNMSCSACVPNFIAPDTVCLGTRVTINNLTTCGSTYKWDFCKGVLSQLFSINALPTNSLTAGPVQCNVYKDGSNYVGFFHNYRAGSQKTIRMNFGTNILNNNPTYIDMSNFGNSNFAAPTSMDIIKEGNNYYGFATNSNNTFGRLDFGNSLTNTPSIGGVFNVGRFPLDIKIVKDGNNFVGFMPTVGGTPSTGILYKIDFGTSITNTPTLTNMGNLGALGRVISVNVLQKNSKWYLFAVNDRDPGNTTPYDNTIAKLSFGNSLSNVPTVINFGNPNNYFDRPQDLVLYNECEQLKGYVVNLSTTSRNLIDIVFNGNETGTTISTINRGVQALFNAANSFSNIINVGTSKITFIANANNDNILRMDLSRCSNANIPTSTLYNPPVFTADSLGTLNVTLTVDEGLSSEVQVCKEIVVIDTIKKPDARINTITCSTDSIRLTIANIDSTTTYSWTGPNGFTSIKPNVSIKFTGAIQAGQYIVTGTGRCGTKKDTVSFVAPTGTFVTLGRDTSICQGQSVTLNATTSGTVVSYLWNTNAITPTISVNQTGTYFVKVTADGCSASDTIRVTVLTPPNAFNIGNDTTYCGNFSRVLSTGNAGTVWSTGVTAPQITVTQPNTYIATITNTCGSKKDTIVIKQNNIPLVNLGRDTSICQGSSVTLNATTSGTVVSYLWNTNAITPTISVNQTGTYFVKVTADGCSASDTIRVTVLTPPNAFSIGNDTTYCGNFSRILSTGNAGTVWSTGVTAPQITVTQPNTYIATITNTCGSKKDTIVIKQNSIPLVNLGRDTSICQGQSVTLNATTSGTVVSYLWNTNAITPTISVNQTGTYFVKVTADGCSASDTIRVTVLTPPNAFNIGNDTTYCGNFSRVLSTGNAGTVWSTGVTAPQITVTQPNTYIATITNTCGSKKDTIVIKQNNIPLVSLGRDSSICQGSSVTLNATTSGTVVSYLWNTNAITPTISVNQTGIYFVKVTADGCSASDTIRVTVLTPPNAFSIGNDTTYCGSFSKVLSTGNASTVWSTGVTAPQITVTQPNTYIATIVNICGSESDSVVIKQDAIPSVEISKDTMICGGQTILLTAITNATQFIWNTGETGNSITINEPGKYWVSVTNNTCSAIDTAYVLECEGDLWVPTAFSPNNDGVNDYFKIFGKNVLEYRLLVFDRWGAKLYESNDINISWNGVYKGEVVQLDSYAWVIEYKIILSGKPQNKMKKGTVTVFR